MNRTFIVKETVKRTWLVELSEDFMERTQDFIKRTSIDGVPSTDFEAELRLAASDLTADPDPSVGTVTLLSASTKADTEEVES